MAKPTIVCLCGSTRFIEQFDYHNMVETLQGKIVLSVGCHTKSDDEFFGGYSVEELNDVKARLDILHYQKIDLCDEILVVDIDGYIGESTRREIYYAQSMDKTIRYVSREKYDSV